jgi:hypothetical protein
MSLQDLFPNVVKVEVLPGKSVEVRPLTTEGVAFLLKNYRPEMEGLFQGKLTTEDLMLKAPDFMAALIASSCSDASAEEVEVAKTLPIGVQLKLLGAIWEMSMIDPEELGKYLARLVEGLKGVADGLTSGLKT